jgi:uncharacterized protein with FMN-binding domain
VRRAIVTTTATAAGVVLLLSLKPHGGQSAGAQSPIISSGSGADTATAPTPAPTSTTPGPRTTTKAKSGSGSTAKSASGSYTGTAVDTRYGPVQVRIDVSGGKIGKIDVLQYPNGLQRDVEINGYALPVLNQEALSAQNAQIDMVSGATYTSTGYIQSLQSALDRAGLK